MTNGVILFFLYVPIMTFMALVLAVVLNSKRVRGFRFFRTLLFIPYIMNIVAAGFTFRLRLNQKYGLVNLMLGIFNIAPVPWLESVWGSRVSLCLLVIWARLGYNMVIMLAGLQTIPGELTEAALIDGAGEFTIFWRIILPIVAPGLTSLGLIFFMSSWNDFLGPLIYLKSPEHFTLPLIIHSLIGPVGRTVYDVQMAASVISLIPLLIIFLTFQGRIVEGITAGAIKG